MRYFVCVSIDICLGVDCLSVIGDVASTARYVVVLLFGLAQSDSSIIWSGVFFSCVNTCCSSVQVALNYLDSQPRPGQMEARLLKMAGVK